MISDNMDKIKEIIPHTNIVFKVNVDKPPSEVNLKATEWAIITQIDGRKTIQEIIDNLSLTEEESLPLFYNLLQHQLIEIKDLKKSELEYASGEFFKNLEGILVKVIGPVASYIIDDVLWELNENRDKFLKEKIPLLIESISQEIKDEDKRFEFQQEMLGVIKNL
jgi:hypothetical protein